jgi:hypothetical protein
VTKRVMPLSSFTQSMHRCASAKDEAPTANGGAAATSWAPGGRLGNRSFRISDGDNLRGIEYARGTSPWILLYD